MTFRQWLTAHEGLRMKLYLGETGGGDGCAAVTGRLACHEDFVTVDQADSESACVVAIHYRAITSAVEMVDSCNMRVKAVVEALRDV